MAKPVKILLVAIFVLILAAGIMFLAGYVYVSKQANPAPSPEMPANDIIYNADEFPEVSWEYWKQINPDIIGWVSIPGTSINHPIVQAHAQNPNFYLNHDVYKEWNYLGCPYLDAECERDGFDSRCAIVYGHNASTGKVFADLGNFKDKSFAGEHSYILLQTPNSKQKLCISAVNIVKGTDQNRRVRFENAADFNSWYTTQVKNSFFQIGYSDANEIPSNVVAFCTCSYNFWPEDERTIIYSVVESVQRQHRG